MTKTKKRRNSKVKHLEKKNLRSQIPPCSLDLVTKALLLVVIWETAGKKNPNPSHARLVLESLRLETPGARALVWWLVNRTRIDSLRDALAYVEAGLGGTKMDKPLGHAARRVQSAHGGLTKSRARKSGRSHTGPVFPPELKGEIPWCNGNTSPMNTQNSN